MKKYQIGIYYALPICLTYLFFKNIYITSIVFLAITIPILLGLIFSIINEKVNDKIFYIHSKNTAGLGESKSLSGSVFVLAPFFYFFTFAILLIDIEIDSSAYLPLTILLIFLNLPGIYLASKKNFLIFFNKKMNYFPFRLFFLIPVGFVINAGIIILLALLVLMFDAFFEIKNIIYTVPAIFIIGDFITIFCFKKYILKDDLPSEHRTDFMEHELYFFMPVNKRINDRASYDIPVGISIKDRIRVQVRDLLVNSKKPDDDFIINWVPFEKTLNDKTLKNDILFTRYGALVVSNKTAGILEKNNLTGYQLRNIWDEKTKRNWSANFQLVSTSVMPQMSSQTKIKKGIFNGALIPDDKIYYDSSVLNNIFDFNQTFEYIGENQGMPYYHQKFWIVSKKAMEVLINQLGRQKREFTPVILVDKTES